MNVEKSKKLSIVITVVIVLIASGIGFFYLLEYTQPNQLIQPIQSAQPANIHHFQIIVNDTFAVGEKHG